MDLLRATQDRDLILGGRRPIRVPPPTVRAALSIHAAAEASTEEDGGVQVPGREAALTRKACREWLPMRAHSVLFGNAFSWGRRMQVLGALLQTSIPDRVQQAATDSDGEADFYGLISRYRSHFGASFEEVMAEPWPRFLADAQEILRHHAQEQMRFLRAYTAVRSEDGGEILEEIQKSARPPTAEDDTLSEEEKEERRRKRDTLMAEAYQKRQHLLN